MTDDLHNDVFRDDARQRLKALNAGLLKLELRSPDDAPHPLIESLLDEARHLKTAAREAEAATVATIAHYLETVLNHLRDDVQDDAQKPLAPGTADALYDGLDLIERLLFDDARPDDDLIARAYDAFEGLDGSGKTTVWEALREGPVSVALLDVSVNGETSFELAREVERRGGRVVFATGYDLTETELRGDSRAMLPKPYRDEDLARMVRDAAEHPRQAVHA